jgi:hypothetical protein
MDVRDLGPEGQNWIGWAQDNVQWQAFVDKFLYREFLAMCEGLSEDPVPLSKLYKLLRIC